MSSSSPHCRVSAEKDGEESPGSYVMQRLSTIKEMNQSAEKEPDLEKADVDFLNLKQRLFAKPVPNPPDFSNTIKSIADQMDLHRNGILYLKEFDLILSTLDEELRQPVGEFLLAYLRQTNRITLSVDGLERNLQKALALKKYGLETAMTQYKAQTEGLNNAVKKTETKNMIRSSGIVSNPASPRKRLCESSKPLVKQPSQKDMKRAKNPLAKYMAGCGEKKAAPTEGAAEKIDFSSCARSASAFPSPQSSLILSEEQREKPKGKWTGKFSHFEQYSKMCRSPTKSSVLKVLSTTRHSTIAKKMSSTKMLPKANNNNGKGSISRRSSFMDENRATPHVDAKKGKGCTVQSSKNVIVGARPSTLSSRSKYSQEHREPGCKVQEKKARVTLKKSSKF